MTVILGARRVAAGAGEPGHVEGSDVWGPQGAILASTATNPLEVPTSNPALPSEDRRVRAIEPHEVSPHQGLRLETRRPI